MKFNQQADLNASLDEVDLENWLFISPLIRLAAVLIATPYSCESTQMKRHMVSVARTALEGRGDQPHPAVQPSSTVAVRRSASGPDPARWG
jgi:hypothetical protein